MNLNRKARLLLNEGDTSENSYSIKFSAEPIVSTLEWVAHTGRCHLTTAIEASAIVWMAAHIACAVSDRFID